MIEEYFRGILGVPNNNTLEEYSRAAPKDNVIVTADEVRQAVQLLNKFSSPGHDRVLASTIKNLELSEALATITNIMLATSTVPTVLQAGKTVLIPKKGDLKEITNWRPLTIYSVLRRAIEKALNRHLQDQIDLNPNQRGFVTGLPGVHINAILINAVLTEAKANKSDCYVAFLDISKAFDNTGHLHISKCLEEQGVSPKPSQAHRRSFGKQHDIH